MTKAAPITLESLRHAPQAAWLWDGARARIVWANKAAIASFGGQSLFDLIDRPFDLGEPGIERISEFAKTLPRGESVEALLHFPSTGQQVPIHADCMIHALVDGRAGVLVIEKSNTPPVQPALAPEVMEVAFDAMPMPALFLDAQGKVIRLNGLAKRLVSPEQRISLRAIIGDEALALELHGRLAGAATASTVQSLATTFGLREIRLTLQRLGDNYPSTALLLLDDITERRLMERRMEAFLEAQGTSQEPMADDAFETLGRKLSDELTAQQDREPVKAAVKIVAAPPPEPPEVVEPVEAELRLAPEIPQALRDTINRVGDALLISQNDKLIFANDKALKLLGFATVGDLINDDCVWNLFSALRQSLPAVTIGERITATVAMSIVAWHGGPARQFLLHPVTKPGDTREAKASLAEPAKVVETTAVSVPVVEAPVAIEPAGEIAAPAMVEPALAEVLPPASNVVVLQQPGHGGRPNHATDEELRAILDTASDGIITLDRLGRIQTFSAGAEAIFGYRIAEVADQPLADLLTPDSRKTLKEYLAAMQGPGLARILNDGREVTAVVKQGGPVPLFLTIGVLQSRKSTAAFCAVVRDMTQWKRTEKELREAKEAAEETSRQKSAFLARISHELRTPLNAILGFSEVMRMERFGAIQNEKYRGYVNDIHASGSHLLSLINDLLDLSKVEAGKLELNFTAVNLNDVVDHAIRLLQEPATIARVVVRKAIPATLPNVVADLRSMRQIMLNLLSNAIKFTDPGGQVIISAVLADSGSLALRVKDTGIGMDSTQINDALEPFKRIEAEGRETSGTGLGLPLTKALAEANRAGFSISSEPRKGTLIEITFPTTRVLAE